MKKRAQTKMNVLLKARTYLFFGIAAALVTLYGCSSTGESRFDAPLTSEQQDVASPQPVSVLLNQDQSALYHHMVMEGNYSDAAILESFQQIDPAPSSPASLFMMVSVPQASQSQQTLKPQPGRRTGSGPKLSAHWHANVGWTLVLDGNYRGAESAYRQALRKNEKSAKAYLGLGMALHLQGNRQQAISAYEQAIKLEPDYAAALVHLGYAYTEGDNTGQNIAKARTLFQKASKLGDPFALLALLDLQGRKDSV